MLCNVEHRYQQFLYLQMLCLCFDPIYGSTALPFMKGRFAHEAALRSSMLYSLPGTCKMHGIEPYTRLKNTLQKIADHPVNKLHELLPQYG